jgi:putative transcriptional regulator
MYKSIILDRENLTLMGVQFDDIKSLESTANAIGSNMFEGYDPSPQGIALIRDYVIGKISFSEFIALAKEKAYV